MPDIRFDLAQEGFENAERERVKGMSAYERDVRRRGYRAIAGIDEAGRGALAGPVVAAACILPPDFFLPFLNDSKQVAPEKREMLFAQLITDPRVSFGIGKASAQEIDSVNILRATLEAMRLAVQNLSSVPDFLLVDGNRLPSVSLPAEAIVEGDSKCLSIAAASIIAKVTRDRLMVEESQKWPIYGFEKHKGYGTARHLEAIYEFGPCPIHRKSFDPIAQRTFAELSCTRPSKVN